MRSLLFSAKEHARKPSEYLRATDRRQQGFTSFCIERPFSIATLPSSEILPTSAATSQCRDEPRANPPIRVQIREHHRRHSPFRDWKVAFRYPTRASEEPRHLISKKVALCARWSANHSVDLFLQRSTESREPLHAFPDDLVTRRVA